MTFLAVSQAVLPDNCGKCAFVSKDVEELNSHIDDNHKSNITLDTQNKEENLDNQEIEDAEVVESVLKENEAYVPSSPASENGSKCKKCSMKFDDQESFKKHMKEKHIIINVYNCTSCDYRTTVLEDFKVHVDTIHLSVEVKVTNIKVSKPEEKVYRFKCNICEYQCKLRKQLFEHHKSKHITQCDECEYSTDDREKMVNHKNYQHALIDFNCDVCNFTTRTPYVMQRHKVDVHDDREEARFNTMQELFLTGLAAQVDNLMMAVIGSKEEVVEQLSEIKAKNDILETELVKTREELSEMKKAFIKSNVFCNDMQNDSEAMLKNVSDRCAKLEDVAEKLSKKEKRAKDVPKSSEKPSNKKDAKGKHKVTWVGTSISKVLDQKKFEHDVDVKLTAVKAYCVKEEGRFPKDNFKAIVPRVVEAGNVDTLVLETGSIEITNMDVNKAMIDPNKDIKEYKKEWFAKAEEVSTELFNIAEDAIAADRDLHVIIVKRLPRFDRGSNDIMKIKSSLSSFANQMYDQLWLKRGSSERIHVVDFKIFENEGYLKDLIYGTHENARYDGIHLIGNGASRHFTYRAIQAIKPIISKPNQHQKPSSFWRQTRNTDNYQPDRDNHLNCPQANYKRQSASGQHGGRRSDKLYSDVFKSSNKQSTGNKYNVPTKNFFNPLNC